MPNESKDLSLYPVSLFINEDREIIGAVSNSADDVEYIRADIHTPEHGDWFYDRAFSVLLENYRVAAINNDKIGGSNNRSIERNARNALLRAHSDAIQNASSARCELLATKTRMNAAYGPLAAPAESSELVHELVRSLPPPGSTLSNNDATRFMHAMNAVIEWLYPYPDNERSFVDDESSQFDLFDERAPDLNPRCTHGQLLTLFCVDCELSQQLREAQHRATHCAHDVPNELPCAKCDATSRELGGPIVDRGKPE